MGRQTGSEPIAQEAANATLSTALTYFCVCKGHQCRYTCIRLGWTKCTIGSRHLSQHNDRHPARCRVLKNGQGETTGQARPNATQRSRNTRMSRYRPRHLRTKQVRERLHLPAVQLIKASAPCRYLIETVFAAVETRPQSASMNAGEDSRLNDEAFAEAVLRAVELDKSISDLNKDSWHRDKPIWVDMGLTLMSMFRSVPSVCTQTFRCRRYIRCIRQTSCNMAMYAQAL